MDNKKTPFRRFFRFISYLGLEKGDMTDIFDKGKILSNQLSFVFLSFNILTTVITYVFFKMISESRAMNSVVLFYIVLDLLFAGIVVINRLGRHYLAGILLVICALSEVVFNAIQYGNAFSIEYYIPLVMIMPFLIFPKTHWKTITVLVGLNVAVSVFVFVWFYRFQPVILIDPEQLTYFKIANFAIFAFMLVFAILYLYNANDRAETALAKEIERSDALLANILPRKTIDELKRNGFVTPASYDSVSVLFTDFKGFTLVAEKMTPEELVGELDRCFRAFDAIAQKYGLEKLKTIGDSYMCAGGIPETNGTHAVDCVLAALEMQAFVKSLGEERASKGQSYWEVRIGVHTGPVVAGVIGEKKFAYDIWGDTVNTASRMESSGTPGLVNVSEATYERVKEWFDAEYRGKVKAKNKGELDMYTVVGLKPEFGSVSAPGGRFFQS